MKENLLEKCPLCGAKIVDAYNSVTKQFYYKCENSECHFRLPKNYTEQEVSLQGIELKAICGGCGNPLTIACGPNSLYATCLRCDYDLRPNMVYGFVFKKHANAHNPDAKQEIKELKEAYKGIVDEDYSFDDFLGTEEELQEECTQKEVADESTQKINENELFGKVSKKEYIHYYNKGYTINQLSIHFDITRSQARGIKKYLIAQGVISTYVGKDHDEDEKDKTIRISKEPREGSALQKIINCMKENLNTKFDIETLHSATGIVETTIGNYLTQLRKTRLAKIVGYRETSPLTILYQVVESPLEEISYKTFEDGYTTLGKFFRDHESTLKEISRSLTPTVLKAVIEKSSLISYLVLAEKGLSKGYNEKDLLAFVKRHYDEPISINEEVKNEVRKKYKRDGSRTTTANTKLSSYAQSALEKILKLLNKNTEKAYTSDVLNKKLGYDLTTIQIILKKLRLSNKIKVVGHEGSKVLYQVIESPLPELDVYNKENKYATLYNFVNSYNNLKISKASFMKKAEKENLPIHPILTRSGISKGYEIKELVRLADKYYQESSIKRASEESLDNVIEVHQENMSDSISSYTKRLLSNLFKNKEKANTQTEEELISF